MISPNRVSIRIHNNGNGVPTTIKNRIFDPFFTTKPIGQGTGLGLYMSYQIVTKHHNGDLQCYSELGEGTEFCLELPLA